MTNAQFASVTGLQYENQALRRKVDRYESDPEYVRLKQEKADLRAHYERVIARKDRTIKELEHDLNHIGEKHRHMWFDEVYPDVLAQHEKELEEERARRAAAEEKAARLEELLQASREKSRRHAVAKYNAETKAEKLEEENKELRRRLNQNHLNSSQPTSAEAPWNKAEPEKDKSSDVSSKGEASAKPKKGHTHNSRTNNGGGPKGARKGHKASFLERQKPTRSVRVRPGAEITDSPDWERRPDLDEIRQVTDVEVKKNTTDYVAEAYRNRHTGKIVRGEFPPDARRPVNYGSTLKALIVYMVYYLNVSENRVQTFLAETTNGQLRVSAGFISKVGLEFSKKTEAERDAIIRGLHASAWAAADTTAVILNGQQEAISICANDRYAYYSYTPSKGHAAAKALPIHKVDGVPFCGTLLSDSEPTFANYGTAWQLCLAHILRELMESIENESDRRWNAQMRDLLQSIIHECKQVLGAMSDEVRAQVSMEKGILSEEQIQEFLKSYQQIIATGQEDYEYDPPTWYKKGRALLRRLEARAEDVLYFLHHGSMPWTNNLCERMLRIWVRKRRQAISFRSPEHIHACCHFLSFLETRRLRSCNIFMDICGAFNGTLMPLDA